MIVTEYFVDLGKCRFNLRHDESERKQIAYYNFSDHCERK